MSSKSSQSAVNEQNFLAQNFFVRQFVKHSKFQQFKYVKRGRYGAVYRDNKNTLVAAKILLGPSSSCQRDFKNEVKQLKKCDHIGIVKTFQNELSDSQCFF